MITIGNSGGRRKRRIGVTVRERGGGEMVKMWFDKFSHFFEDLVMREKEKVPMNKFWL